MKYMLMMNHPGKQPYAILQWSKDAIAAHMQHMKKINASLREKGEWVDGQGLTGPDRAKLVKAGKDGRPITDGVFPETKEFLAGFWIVDVDSAERVYQLAAEISVAPGPDGKPMHMNVEVREVMDGPPPA